MDIKERGKRYAEGKALLAIDAAIEQAYIDGYNDGLKHLENEKLEALKEGVEYVDLELTSGTLWSSRCIRDDNGIKELPYLEASKLSIPTKEQYEELYSKCRMDLFDVEGSSIGIKFTGNNGKTILFHITNNHLNKFEFWLRDDSDSEEKNSAELSIINGSHVHIIKETFMGYKLPIMLVKNKQK